MRSMTNGGGRNMAARRDAAVVAAVAVAAAVLCVKLDLSEALLGWTRLHERLQLDELPAVLLAIAGCLIWFSARRYFEARAQLRLRVATEARLVVSLAENQRLAQQYVDLQESERKALARDLHDELGQYLNVIKLDAVAIRDGSLGRPGGDAAAMSAARAVIENVDRVYGVVSSLIRQLRPVGFDDLGLAAALEHCVGDWRARLPDMALELIVDGAMEPVDEARALTVYRLVQEALTNVARHAAARRVTVKLERLYDEQRERVIVSITDDGRGADLSRPPGGLGLVGMRERVSAVGGSLDVASRPGEGFRVSASIPLVTRTMAGRHS